jgi:hypothetical protein
VSRPLIALEGRFSDREQEVMWFKPEPSFLPPDLVKYGRKRRTQPMLESHIGSHPSPNYNGVHLPPRIRRTLTLDAALTTQEGGQS